MGHAIQILTFDVSMDKKKIQEKCDTWGDHNADLEERGWVMGGGLGSAIRFKDGMIFNDYEEAEKYLYGIKGSYHQTAVKYKEYPKTNPTKAMTDLENRIDEYRKKIAILNQPHYMGVKQATVKCKSCGSSLATSFCGKTFNNTCPVCRAELRPQSTIDKLNKYKATVKELESKLKTEEKKLNAKNEKKAKIKWAVFCEVHC